MHQLLGEVNESLTSMDGRLGRVEGIIEALADHFNVAIDHLDKPKVISIYEHRKEM